jgi:glucose/arabinose dehydrogenase
MFLPALASALLAAAPVTPRWEVALGSLTFEQPLGLATAPGEPGVLYVVEKGGTVQRVTGASSGKAVASLFLDLRKPRDGKLVTSSECGLLGLAFHPRYAENHQLFVLYSLRVDGKLYQRLSRFEAGGAPPRVDAQGETPFISQLDPAENHNGGDVHFGPDGLLYFSAGDGGGAGDSFDHGGFIDRGFFAGIFRLDVDRRPGSLLPPPDPAVHLDAGGEARYAVPADNPFHGATVHRGRPVDAARLRTETWATGLRNPWRFSHDAPSRRWFTADVGQNRYEEVDLLRAGGDYGWPLREGSHPFGKPRPGNAAAATVLPLFEYDHASGSSITGGRVYRGKALPGLAGTYVFGDFVSGRTFALREGANGRWTHEELPGVPGVVAFGELAHSGELLAVSITEGKVYVLKP